ncbi:MAG TPA: ATP-binding protein, partial [Yeosuana sp.]
LSCYDSLRSKIEAKNLVIEKELHDNLPDIKGNQFLLEQAFINLLDNAIKYTPENGTIGFKTRPNEDTVEIEIFDTGIGIPKESIPRIFERFYRVDKDRSRQEGGTGLGLSIVKHTINIHGGEIKVESEMSKGTKFIINLPVG